MSSVGWMELSAEGLTKFFATVLPVLGERDRRVVTGAMVVALARGGQARVVETSGQSSSTVFKAAKEVEAGVVASVRQRRRGGGDRLAIEKQPGLLAALDDLVYPESRGDPMSPLRYTAKSTYRLAEQLGVQGWQASAELVRNLLHQMEYSLQAPSKQLEGLSSPDRDAQFRYINALAEGFLSDGEPVISVDTKKKELLGNYDNNGVEWQLKGQPVKVNDHDFPSGDEYAKAIPYGVFDVTHNEGWVNVGDTADTAEFAVESIRRWWNQHGRTRFPDATRLLITADCGGSNGYRVRAWKKHLADLATETGLLVTVCHYPPGTSKWNKIEHRMFSFISKNWRGTPLTSLRTVVELIAATTTKTGLKIYAEADFTYYPKGVKISDTEFDALPVEPHDWHGPWNYTIKPAT